MPERRANKRFESLLTQLKETGITKSDLTDYSKETLTAIKEVHEKVAKIEALLGREHDPHKSISDISEHLDELLRELRNRRKDPTSKIQETEEVPEKDLKKDLRKLQDNGADLSEEQATLGLFSKETILEIQKQTGLLQSLVKNTTKSDFKKKDTDLKKDVKEEGNILTGLLSTIGSGVSKVMSFLTSSPLLTMGIAALVAMIGKGVSDALKYQAGRFGTLKAHNIAEQFEIAEDTLEGVAVNATVADAESENTTLSMTAGEDIDTKKNPEMENTKQFLIASQGIAAKDVSQALVPRTKDTDMRVTYNKNNLPMLVFDSKWMEWANKAEESRRLMAATLLNEGFAADASNESLKAAAELYNKQFEVSTIEELDQITQIRTANLKKRSQVSSLNAILINTTNTGEKGATQVAGLMKLEMFLDDGISSLTDVGNQEDLATVLDAVAKWVDGICLVAKTLILINAAPTVLKVAKGAAKVGVFILKRVFPKLFRVAGTFLIAKGTALLASSATALGAVGTTIAAAAPPAAVVVAAAIALGAVIYFAANYLDGLFKTLSGHTEEQAAKIYRDTQTRFAEEDLFNRMVEDLQEGKMGQGTFVAMKIADRTYYSPYHVTMDVAAAGKLSAEEEGTILSDLINNFGLDMVDDVQDIWNFNFQQGAIAGRNYNNPAYFNIGSDKYTKVSGATLNQDLYGRNQVNPNVEYKGVNEVALQQYKKIFGNILPRGMAFTDPEQLKALAAEKGHQVNQGDTAGLWSTLTRTKGVGVIADAHRTITERLKTFAKLMRLGGGLSKIDSLPVSAASLLDIENRKLIDWEGTDGFGRLDARDEVIPNNIGTFMYKDAQTGRIYKFVGGSPGEAGSFIPVADVATGEEAMGPFLPEADRGGANTYEVNVMNNSTSSSNKQDITK